MPFRKFLVGIAIAATMTLTACSSVRPIDNASAKDDRYGIPPYSVPSTMMKPDGFMTNGLSPAQPYS